MTELQVRSPSPVNVVEGFSARFNELLDRAQFPRESRIARGSERFAVVVNTFKSWCTNDRIPGTHAQLTQIVDDLLKEIPGPHNTRAVVAWLLAGDAVPHPFKDESDALSLVELYLQISRMAKARGIDFESVPREVRNLIVTRAMASLNKANKDSKRGASLNAEGISVVMGMLDTVRAMS